MGDDYMNLTPDQVRQGEKLINSGKVDISKFGSRIKSMLMEQNREYIQDPRERLRARLSGLRDTRRSHHATKNHYDRVKEDMEERKLQEKGSVDKSNTALKNKKKRHNKKLKQWSDKLGKVSFDDYTEAMVRFNKNQYESAPNRDLDRRIIDVYNYQNRASGQCDELEELLA